MAQGLAIALPLSVSEIDGAYRTHKDLISMAEQNLKMLILTSPGERCMTPDFGIGIRRYLFEQNITPRRQEILTNIKKQAAQYLPYIDIVDLDVFSPPAVGNTGDIDTTRLNVSLTYIIPTVNIGSNLTIPVSA